MTSQSCHHAVCFDTWHTKISRQTPAKPADWFYSSSVCLLIWKFKNRNAISRKGICKRILLTVTFLFFRFVADRPFFTGSTEFLIIAVKNQPVWFTCRHAYPVIFSCHRREITDKQQTVLSVLALSDKTENASFVVIGVDPLKTVPDRKSTRLNSSHL